MPLLLAAPAAAAPQPPTCTVSLESQSAIARPTSTNSDTLTFKGNVHVTMGFISGSRTLHIDAAASPDTWAASVDPATKDVTGTMDVNFTASVGVPAAELAATAGRLIVTAHFQWVTGAEDPSTECSSQANIQVAQYYMVNADAVTPRILVNTGPVGQTASVLVQNLGNGRDTFRVELENRAELEAIGIITSLPLSATLAPNTDSNLTFTINASSGVEDGEYDLFIMVTSSGDPTLRRDTQVVIETKKSIVDTIFDPTVFVVLAAVAIVGLGTIAAVRSRRRKKRARLAKKKLDQIRRQQRQAEAGAADEGEARPERATVRARPEPPYGDSR